MPSQQHHCLVVLAHMEKRAADTQGGAVRDLDAVHREHPWPMQELHTNTDITRQIHDLTKQMHALMTGAQGRELPPSGEIQPS